MGIDTTLCAASLFAATSLALIWRWRRSRRPSYPPGPKGYPLIGNVLDLPQNVPIWKTFMSLAKQYGVWPFRLYPEIQLEMTLFEDTDVLHLTVITTDYVVLGSAKAISDLAEKRSNVYSDRVRYLTAFVPIWANDIVSASLSDA
jgi:hypothetical protein